MDSFQKIGKARTWGMWMPTGKSVSIAAFTDRALMLKGVIGEGVGSGTELNKAFQL